MLSLRLGTFVTHLHSQQLLSGGTRKSQKQKIVSGILQTLPPSKQFSLVKVRSLQLVNFLEGLKMAGNCLEMKHFKYKMGSWYGQIFASSNTEMNMDMYMDLYSYILRMLIPKGLSSRNQQILFLCYYFLERYWILWYRNVENAVLTQSVTIHSVSSLPNL
jgi:hypothetical protein